MNTREHLHWYAAAQASWILAFLRAGFIFCDRMTAKCFGGESGLACSSARRVKTYQSKLNF